jgi:type IV pilus assembly protein PilQ
MRIRYLLFISLFVAGIIQLADAQAERAVRRAAQGKPGASQDELVSFNADVPYSKAIMSLGELSKKIDGKLLIDRSSMQGKDKAIGINIESMYWKDALELILRSNQLWYNDYPEYMEIVSFEDIGKHSTEQSQKDKEISSTPSAAPTTPTTPVVVDSSEYYSKVREINISSVFFDVNKTKLAQSGISFSIFRGRGLNLGVDIFGADKVSKQAFSAYVKPNDSRLAVTIDAAINMFESEQLGDVIARPQITVRSGTFSTFQIGQNFSVLEKDFSGNTVQKFYPTGTILTVRPKIYQVGDMEFIDVLYSIEKSSFETSTLTTVINKTSAQGSLTLLNGEEGYVGGMYSNEQTTLREGVPILKDLPWWVFGLRYLFGYDSKNTVKRELIVLIKAEILPSLEVRSKQQPGSKNILQDSQREMDKDLERRTGKKNQ